MQPSSTHAPTVTGELIATFRHGKGFLMFTLLFAILMVGLAGFVVYLATLLPSGSANNHEADPKLLIYAAAGLLAVISAVLFGIHFWQKKLRATHYEVHEHGIVAISAAGQNYTAFAEIEDLYLFGSGQTGFTGLITNLAYRRNEREPFHRVIESLKGFQDFQQMVRELHVRARLPLVVQRLESGGAVSFRFVPTGQVWSKRLKGDFLNVTTQTIILTSEFLDVEGRKVPVSSLRSVDMNTWTEKVTIKDEAGSPILSTVCTGILSHDLFLTTLDVLLDAQREGLGEKAPTLV